MALHDPGSAGLHILIMCHFRKCQESYPNATASFQDVACEVVDVVDLGEGLIIGRGGVFGAGGLCLGIEDVKGHMLFVQGLVIGAAHQGNGHIYGASVAEGFGGPSLIEAGFSVVVSATIYYSRIFACFWQVGIWYKSGSAGDGTYEGV